MCFCDWMFLILRLKQVGSRIPGVNGSRCVQGGSWFAKLRV